MPHQDIGWRELRRMEQRAQIADQPAECERRGGGVAPAQTGAIVADHAGEPGDAGLHRTPAQAAGCDARFENDQGTALPHLLQVQTPAANIQHAARRRKGEHR